MNSDKCESFRLWNRIEGSTRTPNMEESLKAELYDPLWMLARQWQFGEFEANDCGTAAKVLLSYKESAIKSINVAGKSQPFDFSKKPPETVVERAKPLLDYKARLQAAHQFFNIISKILTQAGDLHRLKRLFYRSNPLKPMAKSQEKKHRNAGNECLQQFFQATNNNAVDGQQLYQVFKTYVSLSEKKQAQHKVAEPRLLRIISLFIKRSGHHDEAKLTQKIIMQFIRFYEHLHGEEQSESDAWQSSRMEYQFSCHLSDQRQLTVDEYFNGDLDWYHFDITQAQVNETRQVEKVKEYIPSQLEYAGMPSSRWWEIEDGQVDLVNIDASNVDLTKLIVSEFALMYSNDWMIAPLDVRLGTYIQLSGIIVVDVFGELNYVDVQKSADVDSENEPLDWNMFGLSNGEHQTEQGLLLFPSLQGAQESEPLEQVQMARDEAANMVWALEQKVSDDLGGAKEGKQACLELHQQLGIKEKLNSDQGLEYVLATSVPEHWIPFVPVKASQQEHREMKLQRASMPRVYNGNVDKVRPQSSLLRHGIAENNQQTQPFYLHEEEVPTKGITVSRSEQRIRWFNGATINWQGFRKEAGIGPCASSLQFDSLIDDK